MPRTRTRARRSSRTGAIELFVHPEQSAPIRLAGWCWRTRYELALIAGYLGAYRYLDTLMPTWGVLFTLASILLAILVIGPVRRFTHARVMCVVTRHRMRSCLRQVRAMNHDGHLPWFLWTRPTGVGERVRLWMRPGLAGRDIENVADHIAAACFAREARVTVSRRRAALVTVDVIRRDPLVTGSAFNSPLVGMPVPDGEPAAPIEHHRPAAGPVLPTPRPPLQVVPEPAPTTAKRTPKNITTHPAPAPSGSSVLVGGEDVTDYV